MPSCFRLLTQAMLRAFSFALFRAGSSIAARIAMIAITMRSSIRVKIFVFTLEVRTEEQGTWKEEGTEKHWNNRTLEQFNSRRKKEEARSGDWQRPVLPCCRNETSFLQFFLMRSSIKVKIRIFTLRSKNTGQETRKEKGEKHLNKGT